MQKIGRYTFNACRAFETIIIPDTVNFIGEYAFHSCINLKIVHLPNNLTCVEEGVFYDCERLKGEIIVPDSVTSINYGPFYSGNRFNQIIISVPSSLLEYKENLEYGSNATIIWR